MGKFKPGVNVILYFQKEKKKVNFQEPEKYIKIRVFVAKLFWTQPG